MHLLGTSDHNPLCVVNIAVFDHTYRELLMAVRKHTSNERRHIRMLSTITRGVPRSMFASLAGGDPESLLTNPTRKLEPRMFYIGTGHHSANPNVLAVEWALEKAGLGGVLASGQLVARASANLITLREVPDTPTWTLEWTAMLHYEVVLKSDFDRAMVPAETSTYESILWVQAAQLAQARVERTVAAFNDERLQDARLCVGGACVEGAARLIHDRQIAQPSVF